MVADSGRQDAVRAAHPAGTPRVGDDRSRGNRVRDRERENLRGRPRRNAPARNRPAERRRYPGRRQPAASQRDEPRSARGSGEPARHPARGRTAVRPGSGMVRPAHRRVGSRQRARDVVTAEPRMPTEHGDGARKVGDPRSIRLCADSAATRTTGGTHNRRDAHEQVEHPRRRPPRTVRGLPREPRRRPEDDRPRTAVRLRPHGREHGRTRCQRRRARPV